MAERIRLGCLYCDREDLDGVDVLPTDWEDVDEVRSYEDACRPAAIDDRSRSVIDGQTNLGVCPERKQIAGF
jgi:hypothetical protein